MGFNPSDSEDDTVEPESLPEYRVYISSKGSEPVARDIRGDAALKEVLQELVDRYPRDHIYVREVLEHVVIHLGPRM